MSPGSKNAVLACPGIKRGHVHVHRLDAIGKALTIKAHDNTVGAISLNLDGTRLATASRQASFCCPVFCSLFFGLTASEQPTPCAARERWFGSGTHARENPWRS